ncbi:MAG: HaeIII family restriction endonuclease [Candidatus Obscuribacterales bacterium]|nr:HaeIII family restriction endonuclease [Candidatus Obscuribacterales bacterium]
MVTQKQSGKAFEYATLISLQKAIGQENVTATDNSSLQNAALDFACLEATHQENNLLAGDAAAQMLLRFEPQLVLAQQGKQAILLALQSDQAGGLGDVRDIIISVPEQNWEIGISAKNQHEALKHSRLSNKIDFGQKWLGVPCSEQYFAAIIPIFERLQELKNNKLAWSQVPDKDTTIYKPILVAFQNEINSMEKRTPGLVAKSLVSYLIGTQDFYKVIKLKKQTKVQVFNFNGSLNTAARGLQPEGKLDKLKLPTRVVELDFKRTGNEISTTTLDMICDAGWQLSFRLHNASTMVETSLKFDINLVGRPNNLQTFTAIW